jgi:hypothetical protein
VAHVKAVQPELYVVLVCLRPGAGAPALFLATIARMNIPFGKPGTPEAWLLPPPVYGLALAIWGLVFVAPARFADSAQAAKDQSSVRVDANG